MGYDPIAGGPNPWTPIRPGPNDGYKKEYIKCSYPDSANTATTLYTGVKSYNGAIAVDIYEKNLTTILQTANRLGKSTGLVTSVPITHATPGAATATVNDRGKYDADYPALDNILQEAIRPDVKNKFLPTVLLGGGHPWITKTQLTLQEKYLTKKETTYSSHQVLTLTDTSQRKTTTTSKTTLPPVTVMAIGS